MKGVTLEWDEAKDSANFAKNGVGFEEVKNRL